jgi:hypothetical protein
LTARLPATSQHGGGNPSFRRLKNANQYDARPGQDCFPAVQDYLEKTKWSHGQGYNVKPVYLAVPKRLIRELVSYMDLRNVQFENSVKEEDLRVFDKVMAYVSSEKAEECSITGLLETGVQVKTKDGTRHVVSAQSILQKIS